MIGADTSKVNHCLHIIMGSRLWSGRLNCRLGSLVLLFLLCCQSRLGSAQDRPDSLGSIFSISHSAPSENGIRPQLWAIDRWGERIVAAHERGISIRHGEEWRLIGTPGKTTVRSLAEGQDGRLYYGEQGAVGYVVADSIGSFRATSLQLPQEVVDLGNVWGTYSTASGLIFQSRNYLLVWDGLEFEVVKSVSGYHNSFQVGDAVYIREFGVGLLVFESGALEFVAGSEELADEMIFGVTVSSSKTLVWSQNTGIFEVSNGAVVGRQVYSDELQEIAANVRLYTAAQWSDGNVVIGTLGAGAVIVDDEGSVLDRLSIRNGFPDDFINDIHVESASVVWLAFNSEGIGSLTVKPAKLRYAKSHGLWGHVNRVGLIDDRLAVATGSRLMTAVSSNGQNLVYSTNPNTS